MDVIVGVVGRAHGIRGEVRVQPRTDSPEARFAPGAPLRAPDGRTFTVATSRWQSGALVVRLDGVADRSGAEALTGTVLWADVAEADAPGDPDEYHDTALIGLDARDAGGASVGRVARVLHLPAQDVLAIDTPSGERLVPFVRELVPDVDLPGGFLTIAALPGLLDDGDADAR